MGARKNPESGTHVLDMVQSMDDSMFFSVRAWRKGRSMILLQLLELWHNSPVCTRCLKSSSSAEPAAWAVAQGAAPMVWHQGRKRQHTAPGSNYRAFAASTKAWEIFGFHPTLKKDDMVWWPPARPSLSPCVYHHQSSSSDFPNVSALLQSNKFLI